MLNNQHPNETPGQKLAREAKEADERYKAAVQKLDDMRCDVEQTVFLHLKFLERCELDRLKAIKTCPPRLLRDCWQRHPEPPVDR